MSDGLAGFKLILWSPYSVLSARKTVLRTTLFALAADLAAVQQLTNGDVPPVIRKTCGG
jgi:hypothetical protein